MDSSAERAGASPAPGAPSEPAPVPRALRIAVALLFLPLLGALLEVLAHPEVATQRVGDEAPFEARVLTLFDPPALLGPYSRHQWSHPGPLAFWLFGLPYHALGRASFVIPLAALALSAAALASIVRSVLVLTPSLAGRAFGLVCVAILVGKASLTLDPAGTATSWGPACTLLPFAALVLLAAELGTGAWRTWPLVLLLHAFVVQTHVLYLVPASLAVAIGSGLGWRASSASASRARVLGRGGVVLAVSWAPVVIDELVVSGNLEQIAAYFLGARAAASPDAAGAAVLFAWRATEPFRDLIGLGPPVARPDPMEEVSVVAVAAASATVLALAIVLARGLARPPRAPRDGARILAGLVLALLVTGAPLLLRVDVPEWPYLTWWVGALSVLGLLAAGATHLRRALDAHSSRVASVACVGAVLVVGLHTEAQIGRAARSAVEHGRRDADALEPLLPVVAHAHACRPALQLDVGEPSLWGVLGATLTHFGRAGTRLHVAPGWEFMFGRGYHGGDAGARLVILPWDDHGCPAVGRGEHLRLADCRGEGETVVARAAAVPLALTPWQAEGATGDPAWLFDGERGADGAPWNAPGALVLAEGARITFGLPPARLTRVAITSDDNDVLRVEHTSDGEHWDRLADLAPTGAWGQRTHVLDLPGDRVVRALRVGPVAGDGAYAISEIAVEGEPDAVRVVTSVGARGDLGAITDGDAGDLRAVPFEGEAPSITIELPSFPVAAIAVTATTSREVRVEASVDGHTFWEVGRIRAAASESAATRRFHLDDDVLASHVRLTALAGADPWRVAEITPLRAPGAAVDVGLRAARSSLREGFSRHEGDEGWAWIVGRRAVVAVPWPASLPRAEGADVLVSLAPFDGLTSPGTLSVRAGGTSVDVPLAAGLQTVRAHLPARALATDELAITLEASDAISPQALGRSDDARELSLAVHRVEVRPSFLFCVGADR